MASIAAMSSREAILTAVRAGRREEPAPRYVQPVWTGDAVAHFATKARASAADVYEIARLEDAPEAIWSILTSKQAEPRLHFLPSCPVAGLPWQRAPGLSLTSERPSGMETAVSIADFGIAETGTVVFFSSERSAASWHFLPGREIVLVRRDTIVPRLENVIETLSSRRDMPATVNLVTGPSRTADIEQTIERGAHGPRELCVIIAE
jgi:L-lactate dehydrogenase complex protein LldG